MQGGDGNDSVDHNYGTFNGDANNDYVGYNASSSTFDGGEGNDSVFQNYGITINVP
jgi:hypothetical protein